MLTCSWRLLVIGACTILVLILTASLARVSLRLLVILHLRLRRLLWIIRLHSWLLGSSSAASHHWVAVLHLLPSLVWRSIPAHVITPYLLLVLLCAAYKVPEFDNLTW